MTQETIFKVGMKVYDELNYPNFVGTVKEINNKDVYSIKVIFKNNEDTSLFENYTLKGSLVECCAPTLSTAPYTLQGFEQKAPIPTFEEAKEWFIEKNNFIYKASTIDIYPSEEYFKIFEALKRLIILRDYYNQGWKPNWESNTGEKYCIIKDYYNNLKVGVCLKYKRILYFKSEDIAKNFIKEQKELLEQILILL